MDLILANTVESDYSVVFFAAGGHYTPSWNWVWKAYRSLSRKYRKNLKRLVRSLSFPNICTLLTLPKYIVHSTFFSKSELAPFIRDLHLTRRSALLACGCHHQVRTCIYSRLHGLTVCPCSAKFFRKIEYISTLSELAYHVPLTQIDIPPAVYQCVPFPCYALTLNKIQGERSVRARDCPPNARSLECVWCTA